jgi:hypothetical protein
VFTSFTKAEASFKVYTFLVSILAFAAFLFLGMNAILIQFFSVQFFTPL